MSGCTQETERCDYDRYDKHKVSPVCCYKNLMELLTNFHEQAKRLDIAYFLDFGTLLGCVRNGKIIPYDTDIDISMFFDDHDKFMEMKPIFDEKGYVLKQERESKVFYRLFYSEKNSLHVDIHLRKLNENDIYCSHYSVKNWGIHKVDVFP